MVGISNSTPDSVDPLITAINAYIDGVSAFNAINDNDLSDEMFDALAAAMIHVPDAVLRHWQAPARSHEAARAAISLAEREKALFGESPVADAMEAAALGYLKSSGSSPAAPNAMNAPAPIGLNQLSPDMCLTAPEASAYLRVAEITLARWRSTKRGPLYVKSGGRVLYRVSDLVNYMAQSERKGTRPDN